MKTSELTIISHRGSGRGIGEGGHYENTMNAIEYAFNHGADEVEIDLALTKDSIVVISHNKDIQNYTLRELRTLYPNILTFQELITKFPNQKFVLELKSWTDYKKIIDIVYNDFIKSQINLYNFTSFDTNSLMYVKDINSEITCTYIGTSIFSPFMTKNQINIASENGFNEVAGFWLSFRPNAIEYARERNLEVSLGFANNKYTTNYCLKNKVTRLYTDKILTLKKTLTP